MTHKWLSTDKTMTKYDSLVYKYRGSVMVSLVFLETGIFLQWFVWLKKWKVQANNLSLVSNAVGDVIVLQSW